MKAVQQKQNQNLSGIMEGLGRQAVKAASILADSDSEKKNKALRKTAALMRERQDALLKANEQDMELARENGISGAMLDRLALNPNRIEAMASGLESIAQQDDPLGDVLEEWTQPNGLNIARVTVPLGVIGIIYESRPNVTADAAALCLKSGNAAILRGGSESFHSSTAIMELVHEGLEYADLPKDAVQIVPTRERAAVGIMLGMEQYINVIIPRGGQTLTKRVSEESKVPTLLHLTGNCHTYIHRDANHDMARAVLMNAKMRRPGICGATESLLIDATIAPDLLPLIVDDFTRHQCAVRGDHYAVSLDDRITEATEEDWGTEYLSPVISVKVTDTLDEAVAHINHYGSHHTDSIITENQEASARFLKNVDSAIVMHNTSTQFADGGEFGMGAEIGIATGRLHARGPVGLKQLTTYKYVVRGTGQTRPA